MKKIICGLTLLSLAGLLASANTQVTPSLGTNENGAVEQPLPGQNNASSEEEPPPPPGGMMPDDEPSAAGNATEQKAAHAPVVILPEPAKPMAGEIQSDFMPPEKSVGTNNPDELRMNFRNAPLDMVLNYLSDAAGFIIVLDTQVSGNFSVISDQPMTRDEAVNLLNSALNQNGYAAIRNGRTLTIMDKSTAKTHDIPVRIGNDPDNVPDNAEIVTQIIPIRFVDAGQLVTDLTPFVSPQATIVANAEGNSIVITDTQANIRHLMQIIQAVDNGAESETVIRVFRLKYANPTDVATELGSIFPSSSNSNSNSQDPRRQFFARMMGRGGNDSSSNSGSKGRVAAATQVTAVADSRIQAVIVTAQKDLMGQIASMMTNLDVPSARDQQVFVYHLNNADPQQAAQVLQTMFQTSSTSRSSGSSSSSTQTSALMQREQNNATTVSGAASSSGSGFGSSGGQRSGNTQF